MQGSPTPVFQESDRISASKHKARYVHVDLDDTEWCLKGLFHHRHHSSKTPVSGSVVISKVISSKVGKHCYTLGGEAPASDLTLKTAKSIPSIVRGETSTLGEFSLLSIAYERRLEELQT